MNIIKRTFGHLKMVLKHKYYAFHYCRQLGIPMRGLLHDLSKFSPTEFWESVKYYTEKRSPVDLCKEENGYSYAWYHHRGRNKHHWEFWVDNFRNGMSAPSIPFEYCLEMIADYCAAGRTYQGKEWSFQSQLKWWEESRKTVVMHPNTKKFIDKAFELFARSEKDRYEYMNFYFLSILYYNYHISNTEKEIKDNLQEEGFTI